MTEKTLVISTESIAPVATVTKKSEYRKKWNSQNKEKMAEYARNYYNKRCSLDPEYKKELCKRKKENNLKNGKTKNKGVGRPPIYVKDDYGNFI